MSRHFRTIFARMLGLRPPAMQVAALCICPETSRVLLITSRGTGRWIIPKGWPMAGRTLAQAAMQEAWEESGVQGEVSETPIGRYHYDKEQDRSFAIPIDVRVFPVRVSALADDFPEASQRTRKWFTPAEAAELVDESGLKQLLRSLKASSVP